MGRCGEVGTSPEICCTSPEKLCTSPWETLNGGSKWKFACLLALQESFSVKLKHNHLCVVQIETLLCSNVMKYLLLTTNKGKTRWVVQSCIVHKYMIHMYSTHIVDVRAVRYKPWYSMVDVSKTAAPPLDFFHLPPHFHKNLALIMTRCFLVRKTSVVFVPPPRFCYTTCVWTHTASSSTSQIAE